MQVGFTHSNQGSAQEVSITNNEFYFKEENNELIISENGGSIRVQTDDDCLVLKVIQKIPHANLEGAPLQESSTYFMEVGETLSYKESSFKLTQLEPTPVQEAKLEIEAKPEFEEVPEKLPEEETSIEFEEDVNSFDFQIDPSSQPVIEEKKDDGSMSITQVLNIAKIQEEEKLKEKEKSGPGKIESNNISKKTTRKNEVKDTNNYGLKGVTSARDYKGNRKKREAAKKHATKQKKRVNRGLDGENLVGPFTRFLCGLSLLFVTILFSSQIENEAIDSLSEKGTKLINLEVSKYVEFAINQEITKAMILLMIILIVSNLLFSVSPTLFICGATTKGGFLMKRAKALLRTPFDFIAHFIPIFEIPIIFDTPSLKEIITRGAISYRIRAFKFIPILILPIFIALCVGYPIVQQGLKVKNPPQKVSVPKDLGKRPMKFKEILISKKFSQNNIILRIPTLRPVYLFINKESGRTILLKNTTSNFFVSFKKTLESIPFFKYRYPYLSTFLNDEKTSYLVREDFGKILWGGEIIKGMATDDLLYIDFLAINQSKKVFDAFKLPYTEYRNLNKFSSLYRSKLEEVYLYIGEDSLMQFVKAGGTMRSSELEGFTFLARPKVRIEYVDAVEKAVNGTNETFLIELMSQAKDIISITDNEENKKVFKEYTQLLVEYLKSSSNVSAKKAANEILDLNILSI